MDNKMKLLLIALIVLVIFALYINKKRNGEQPKTEEPNVSLNVSYFGEDTEVDENKIKEQLKKYTNYVEPEGVKIPNFKDEQYKLPVVENSVVRNEVLNQN